MCGGKCLLVESKGDKTSLSGVWLEGSALERLLSNLPTAVVPIFLGFAKEHHRPLFALDVKKESAAEVITHVTTGHFVQESSSVVKRSEEDESLFAFLDLRTYGPR